jgi:hypothetical protein
MPILCRERKGWASQSVEFSPQRQAVDLLLCLNHAVSNYQLPDDRTLCWRVLVMVLWR